MKRNVLLSTLLFFSLPLFGQALLESRRTSEWSYIFKLTEEESKSLYEKDKLNVVDDSYFHSPVDSFLTAEGYQGQLNPGHYLQAYANGGLLRFSLTEIYPYDLHLLRNNTDLVVQVLDSTGQVVEDAALDIRGKKLRYDDATQTYRRRKSNLKGTLRLQREGQIAYFRLDRAKKNSWWRRTRNNIVYRTPVKYLWRPLRYVVYMPYDTYRSLRRRRWVGEWARTKRFFESIPCWWTKDCGGRRQNYQGYLVSNKPKYRPGDSLFLKGFVVDWKGRPLKEDLQLILHKNGKRHELGQ